MNQVLSALWQIKQLRKSYKNDLGLKKSHFQVSSSGSIIIVIIIFSRKFSTMEKRSDPSGLKMATLGSETETCYFMNAFLKFLLYIFNFKLTRCPFT